MEELEFRVNLNDKHYTDKDIDLIKFAVSEMFCEGDEKEFLICDEGGREIEVRDYIRIYDFEQFVDNAVAADGYGHFLSPYDGKEHEVNIFGNTFYVYRIK